MARKLDIAAITATLNALDASAENAKISELEAEALRCNEAIQKAEIRCTEITRIVTDWNGPDGQSVADALLVANAESAAHAGPDIDQLKAERAALRSGIGELNRRAQDASYEIRNIKHETVIVRAGEVFDPLIDALVENATVAAKSLAASYAGIVAILDATHTGKASNAKLLMMDALKRLYRFDGLLGGNGDRIAVPDDVVQILRALDGKGPAIVISGQSTVPVP